MAQRGDGDESGRIVVKKVDDASEKSLMLHIQMRVLPESVVYTDKAKKGEEGEGLRQA